MPEETRKEQSEDFRTIDHALGDDSQGGGASLGRSISDEPKISGPKERVLRGNNTCFRVRFRPEYTDYFLPLPPITVFFVWETEIMMCFPLPRYWSSLFSGMSYRMRYHILTEKIFTGIKKM